MWDWGFGYVYAPAEWRTKVVNEQLKAFVEKAGPGELALLVQVLIARVKALQPELHDQQAQLTGATFDLRALLAGCVRDAQKKEQEEARQKAEAEAKQEQLKREADIAENTRRQTEVWLRLKSDQRFLEWRYQLKELLAKMGLDKDGKLQDMQLKKYSAVYLEYVAEYRPLDGQPVLDYLDDDSEGPPPDGHWGDLFIQKLPQETRRGIYRDCLQCAPSGSCDLISWDINLSANKLRVLQSITEDGGLDDMPSDCLSEFFLPEEYHEQLARLQELKAAGKKILSEYKVTLVSGKEIDFNSFAVGCYLGEDFDKDVWTYEE